MSDLDLSGSTSSLVGISSSASKERASRYRCFSSNKRFECDFTWTIEHYRLLNCGRNPVITSPLFSAAENTCRWVLELSPANDVDFSRTLRIKTTEIEIGMYGPMCGVLNCSLVTVNGDEVNEHEGYFEIDSDHTSYGFELFIYKRELYTNDIYMKGHDEVTIHCTITYIHHKNFTHIVNQSNLFEINTSQSNPMENFAKLFNNEELSDVAIYISGKKYPAHKVILATQSSVFKAMFTHNMKEKRQNRININDIDENTFLEALRFMYTGKVENIETMAYKLLPVADKYDLAALKALSENTLSGMLAPETAVEMLSFSDKFNLKNLKAQVLEYIRTNSKKMTESEAWDDLVSQPDLMKMVLESYVK